MILTNKGAPELQWLFGSILGERLTFEAQDRDVFWSRLVRLFYSDPGVAAAWAKYIAIYRIALINPEDAPLRPASDIVVTARDFDGELLDAFSEWMACVKLLIAAVIAQL